MAVVGFHLAAHGVDPADATVRGDILDLARAAHAEAQGGGGSGADVAAAILGGSVCFQEGLCDTVDTPPWLPE